jgi:hypothetical protein
VLGNRGGCARGTQIGRILMLEARRLAAARLSTIFNLPLRA